MTDADTDTHADTHAGTDARTGDPRARRFAAALQALERDRDVAALAALFTDDAVTRRLDARGDRRGEVEAFWREYLEQFSEVRTTFGTVTDGDDRAALEWTTAATLAQGREIEYAGVTVVEFDGDKVARLRTYYDSARFATVPASDG